MTKKKFICKNHIEDYAIERFIYKSDCRTTCYYCSDTKIRTVVEMDQLGEFMKQGLMNFYGNAAEDLQYDTCEGGYLGAKCFNSYDLLFKEISLDVINTELRQDLSSLLPDWTWYEIGSIETTTSERLYYNWEEFRQFVKYKVRFSFFHLDKAKHQNQKVNVSEILKEISNLIRDYKLTERLQANTRFYRCRQHKEVGEIKGGPEICAPPNERVTFSNRMSPAGISMFYASTDQSTAFRETVDPRDTSKSYYTIASFKTKSELDVIDLSKAPPVPSRFDLKKQKHYYPIVFLHQFIHDLSQPILRDGREHIEYVPTQVMTEYIRYIAKSKALKVGGIVYPSAKSGRKTACVLFLNHEESLQELDFESFHVESRSLSHASVHLLL